MPYDASNKSSLPANVQEMSKADREQWVAVWNSSYKACKADGGSVASCEQSSFRKANGVIKAKHTRGGPMNPLQRLWEAISAAFAEAGVDPVERAVVDVASWDGAASNYSSTDAYCNACLIDLNPSGETKTQALCKLPVRKPGGTAYVRQAIHAAAQRMGSMTQPDGVSAADWEAAKKGAAKELIRAYKQADEVAPDSCYEMAGMTPPKRVASAGAVQRLMTLNEVQSQVWAALDQQNVQYMHPGEYGPEMDWSQYINCIAVYYDDDGSLFALVNQGSKFYRVPITVAGEELSLGDMVEISLTGRTTTSRLQVIRDASGARRWFAIAASSVINRVGEIDSTQLFDSFVAFAEASQQYPLLTFYHQKDVIRFGQADLVARDGNLYVASGTFDDTPLGQATADALERNGADWGCSIGYAPLEDPQLMSLAEGIDIPVYTKGINEEISIVLEREAAAHFTRIGTEEVTRSMEAGLYQRWVALYGEEKAKELAATLDQTNRAILESGMVHRADAPAVAPTAAETPATPPAAAPAAPATPPAPPAAPVAPATPPAQEFEIPEELFGALVTAIVENPAIQTIAQGVVALQQSLGALSPRVEALESGVITARTALETRLATLEQSDEQKRAQWQADLPPVPATRVTLRPREVRGTDEPTTAPAMETLAQGTLAKMKSRQPAA